MVAIRPDGPAGDDRAVRRGCAALEEGNVDQGDHVLGSQQRALVNELPLPISSRIENQLAGVAHDLFGDALCISEMGQFGFILGSAFHHAHLKIAAQFDPGLLDHVGIDQRQRPIGGDLSDPVSPEALGKRLGGGGFSIAREPGFWGEVCVGIELVSPGGLLGAGDFDVAEDEDSLAGGELDVDGGIADGEADFVEEGEVGLGNACENDGVGTGGIVGHGREGRRVSAEVHGGRRAMAGR